MSTSTTYIANRFTVDERVCNGKPTVRGLAITVKTVMEFLFAGEDRAEILRQYPDLTNEDLDACLDFANEITNELTPAQKRSLLTAIEQINAGDVLSHEEAKRQIDERLQN